MSGAPLVSHTNGAPAHGAPLLYSSGAPHVRCVISGHFIYSPFPSSGNIFARSIDRNPEQNDEGSAFPLIRQANSSDMTCYSAVHLLHFYVSKSLHSYVGGVRNTADLILIEGKQFPAK